MLPTATKEALLEEAARFSGGPSKWESARAYQAFGEELKRADGNSVKGGFCNDPDRVVSRIDWLENKLLEFSRGAADGDKQKSLKSLIRSQKVDLVRLQESKVQKMSTQMVRSLEASRFLDWRVVEAWGALGGAVMF
ncbi:hypothetical protein CK203_077744 [Vitis vinifera]|uniref:Uncharacterized protein n=1 Tax=Vitis vinifera TaxID=29760 RepID=A0A438BX03_VITVI|nr:hypothetical protein CK203_077744 [Vitis vinifera]